MRMKKDSNDVYKRCICFGDDYHINVWDNGGFYSLSCFLEKKINGDKETFFLHVDVFYDSIWDQYIIDKESLKYYILPKGKDFGQKERADERNFRIRLGKEDYNKMIETIKRFVEEMNKGNKIYIGDLFKKDAFFEKKQQD